MVILHWLFEEWLPIRGYEGLYEVSSFGRVRSLNYNHTGKTKILTPSKTKCGYLLLNLVKNGKRKGFTIHRLVAEAFIPNPKNLPCVNHKSEVKTENMVWNLEWCDYSYNNNYGSKTERGNEKKEKPVLQFTLDGQFVDRYKSIKEASKQTNINYGSIAHMLKGNYKTGGGFIWKYA